MSTHTFLNGLSVSDGINKAIETISKKKLGEKKISFRLKDWGISRQRYWGCPIPIVYNTKGEAIAVDKKDLPILLPDDIDFASKGNPLDKHSKWKYVNLDSGEKVTRETDTLDTFVDSSWYFIRFCSPNYKDFGYNIDDLKYDLENLATPGHTHDEQTLQRETETTNERILLLSFLFVIYHTTQ